MRKLLCVVFFICMAASLAACGRKPQEGTGFKPALDTSTGCSITVAGSYDNFEAFTNAPFDYSFAPIPMTDEGGYFIDSPSVGFSVNKNCDDLDMTNEFMRFLITSEELNEMASVKRLVTPTKDLSFDTVYAPFSQVPSECIISPEVVGIKDPLAVQIRVASFRVGKGELTIDEASAMYGNFK